MSGYIISTPFFFVEGDPKYFQVVDAKKESLFHVKPSSFCFENVIQIFM